MTVENKRSPARALMVQGTASDVGKSLLVAGLCRAYARRGLTVLPFKPQNMSNNAAVTADGGEIGRAQALQALAAGAAPTVDMNPVLLKPQSDTGAQVVVRGRVETVLGARQYHTYRAELLPVVLDSFARLSTRADLVLVEGAGSPAEVNLRDGDIANMGFALAANVAVVLVGDVERGGVIAALAGTRLLLDDAENALVKGCLVNKFRGEPTLFEEAQDLIERHTGWPFLGVVPFFDPARRLPKEDSASLDFSISPARADLASFAAGRGPLKIAVLRLPRVSNFDDLDPLSEEPDVTLSWVEAGAALPGDADVVIVPGSKATVSDLRFVKAQGWDEDIRAHVRRGGYVVGLCAGYQMLGKKVGDPEGREGAPGSESAIGLLDVDAVMTGDKTLARVEGCDAVSGAAFDGYEMHLGLSDGPARKNPWLRLRDGRPEGARAHGGRVLGGYVHGIFAADGFRHAFLAEVHRNRRPGVRGVGAAYRENVERALDQLADHLERHLDLDRLFALAKVP
ncbi:cobyric acid synthase [Varunaivibrio sulfuroxidans]|uniref:Cobyric acid synthase n=1 Tax=Varunaivibrio sulfuroxidans TaxID=1773489 RepID=A0A4R3JG73_9PROT|nr:cobyric acid synthase [Varunaivibrio sulfuroxidans]TCS65149.1 adenosylcobyric acid synthase (glutamine-hydrolysing) [Varunaivibrio sulfuroxidans]WES29567.1 cobyric acid synthase [Varunaivibrio sulfuroxidans]